MNADAADMIQQLIHMDPLKKHRKPLEDEWNDNYCTCENCDFDLPQNAIFLCEQCNNTYCIVCVEDEAMCITGEVTHTFCTTECMDEYIEESEVELIIECTMCGRFCREAEIQHIDVVIGDICYPCLTGETK